MTSYTNEPICTKSGIDAQLYTTIWGEMVAADGDETVGFKRISLAPSVSDLTVQFAVCNYPHNVLRIIYLIMIKNKKDSLAIVNTCLRTPGCVHCARLCVSAQVCVFWLGCVLLLVRLGPSCVLQCRRNSIRTIRIFHAYTVVIAFTRVSRKHIFVMGVHQERRPFGPHWNGVWVAFPHF